jgi:hypothetical protein
MKSFEVQYKLDKPAAEPGANFKLIAERAEQHLTPAWRGQEFPYFHFIRIE